MQFGRALRQILQHISDENTRLRPVHLSKIDIADGFYRIWIDAKDIGSDVSPSSEEALI
jgi:hypothetical protein